jgi:hypothetical protein
MSPEFSQFIVENDYRIADVADKIKEFQIDFAPILPTEAKRRVIGWLENFDRLQYRDFELPLIALEKIDFLKTDYITNELKLLVSGKLATSYLVPLGEQTESSFRITTSFSRSPKMFLSLDELLDNIVDSTNAEIIFLDDFLNSGGQIVSIFYSLLGVPLPDGEISDEIDSRLKLDSQQIEKLKKCKLSLYYYLAFEEGKQKIADLIQKKLGLNIQVFNKDITNKYANAFGSISQQQSIENNLPGKIDGTSIFAGIEYRRLNKFYKILYEIGGKLLVANNPHWNELKFKNKELGYGNLARLIVTDQNIPTITITAIWLNGQVEMNGKTETWNELLPRIKKVLGNKVGNANPNPLPDVKEIINQLEALYIADEFSVGLAKSEYYYNKYPVDLSIIKYVLKYNVREKNSNRILEIIQSFPSNINSDFLKLGYFSLFESQLREANDFRNEKAKYREKLNIAKTNLSKVPSEFHNTSRYKYLMGRYYLEMGWINKSTNPHTDLLKAKKFLDESFQISPYWWTHCYLCIVLKMLGYKNEFIAQSNAFYETIKAEFSKEKDRHILWLYFISAIIMRDDFEDLKPLLTNIDKEVEPNDLEETLLHRIELIFSEDKKKGNQYIKLVKNWLLNIKRK